MSDVLSVTLLNGYIHQIFVAEDMLHGVSVAGEISQFQVRGVHAYFTLKDENSQLSCTCFNYAQTYVPKVGESVIVKGDVDYYAKGGRLSFNVKTIQPLGNGYLALLFEQLKKKLAAGGYFDDAHKKPIPRYPHRVCVITSAQGAVIKDIITTTRQHNDYLDIVIRDVRVQGENCACDVIAAIKEVDPMGYDVIVIARGGGSIEDLQGFNDERLVYTVYDATTPIISAVGHETDFTLCDFVADVRCATPTAAANLIAFDAQTVLNELSTAKSLLMRKLEGKVEGYKSRQKLLCMSLDNAIRARIDKGYLLCGNYSKRLDEAATARLHQAQLTMHELLAKFKSLDPISIVQKGLWSVSCEGEPVTDISQIKINQRLSIRSVKGKITATVTEVSDEI
ncbi:MAG: exodeoxyribonuclease VII large subunit [Christensenellales bacterium]